MTRNRLLTTRNPELAQSSTPPVIAVVIPCFRVTQAILGVLSKIGDEVSMIFVIDDKCPDGLCCELWIRKSPSGARLGDNR